MINSEALTSGKDMVRARYTYVSRPKRSVSLLKAFPFQSIMYKRAFECSLRVLLTDDSDDDDEGDSKTEVRTNRITTRRNTGSRHIVSSRRSTRNQRRISDSSEDHDGDTEDVRQVTNQRTSRSKAKRDSKQVSSSIDESDESGLDNKSKRSSRSNKKAVNGKHSNKRNKRGAEKKCQGENEIINDDKKGGKKKSDKDKGQSKGKLRNR